MIGSKEAFLAQTSNAGFPVDISVIDAAMLPSAGFAPAAPGSRPTARFGGLPHLPLGAEWPMRGPLPHAAAFAEWIGGSRDPDASALANWASPAPFRFLCEYDLAAAREAFTSQPEAGAWPLPDEGRLSFFWEPLSGSFGQSRQNGLVIWTRAPVDGLAPVEPPAELVGSPGLALPMVLPERAAQLVPGWSIDPTVGERLLELADAQRWSESESEALGDWLEANELDQSDWLGHSLLGHEIALQSPPRYAAASEEAGLLDVPVEWDSLEFDDPRADGWLLLLQIGLPHATSGAFDEGFLYFLIRQEHAARGAFENAYAIYQQT
ncbi:DUF1963 domain-containing protein [Acuticoccus sediminis]|uniref:DUF1963 domain-containing protein n=1 Tax=Acuticoccus sediminis TaxID=2184697 RepID=UPI001CFF2CCB|nr:DUF1963 domain-containing protein [Acuticoccus sediminis]